MSTTTIQSWFLLSIAALGLLSFNLSWKFSQFIPKENNDEVDFISNNNNNNINNKGILSSNSSTNKSISEFLHHHHHHQQRQQQQLPTHPENDAVNKFTRVLRKPKWNPFGIEEIVSYSDDDRTFQFRDEHEGIVFNVTRGPPLLYRTMRVITDNVCKSYQLFKAQESNNHTAKTVCNMPIRKKDKKKLLTQPKKEEITIDRIYYINIDGRYRRRKIMEAWLSRQQKTQKSQSTLSSSTFVPYERVPALSGEPDTCMYGGNKCIGVSGLAKTNLHIFDNLNTSGITLILEDDFVVLEMNKLIRSVASVPPDWDIIRFDCWDMFDDNFLEYQKYNFAWKVLVNRRLCTKEEVECFFFGGTHATLYNGESAIAKARKLFGQTPFHDIDARLSSDPSLNSYCMQIGVGQLWIPDEEKSDINPKYKS